MRLGFEAIGGECIFTCEWNKHSQQTYRANFGDEEITGDIRQVSPQDVPHHDVLLAGFPCQPFSIAGVSKKNALNVPHGFACEAQGTLFFNLAELIEHHRPKAFLLENVKNLANHDRGRTFRTIRSILKASSDTTSPLGYWTRKRGFLSTASEFSLLGSGMITALIWSICPCPNPEMVRFWAKFCTQKTVRKPQNRIILPEIRVRSGRNIR